MMNACQHTHVRARDVTRGCLKTKLVFALRLLRCAHAHTHTCVFVCVRARACACVWMRARE